MTVTVQCQITHRKISYVLLWSQKVKSFFLTLAATRFTWNFQWMLPLKDFFTSKTLYKKVDKVGGLQFFTAVYSYLNKLLKVSKRCFIFKTCIYIWKVWHAVSMSLLIVKTHHIQYTVVKLQFWSVIAYNVQNCACLKFQAHGIGSGDPTFYLGGGGGGWNILRPP